MKMIIVLVCMMILLAAKTAFCVVTPPAEFTIEDYWSYSTSSTYERLGDPRYEGYGIDIAQNGSMLTFQLYSGFPESGIGQLFCGDIKITVPGNTGTKDFAIAMTDHGTPTASGNPQFSEGNLYSGTTQWNTSYQWKSYYGYSGSMFNNNVTAANYDSELYDGTVTFTKVGTLSNGYDFNRRDVSVPYNLFMEELGPMNVYWAAATCANDYMSGSYTVTPEPASVILLGLGALGFGALRRKRRI
ncbi:MAG: PEP-CTERM sorting domain-containing protein [Candidatus Omnitrophota bacterium]